MVSIRLSFCCILGDCRILESLCVYGGRSGAVGLSGLDEGKHRWLAGWCAFLAVREPFQIL